MPELAETNFCDDREMKFTITIRWDTLSWCARNGCEKRDPLLYFRLVITSAYTQVCISLSPASTRSLNLR